MKVGNQVMSSGVPMRLPRPQSARSVSPYGVGERGELAVLVGPDGELSPSSWTSGGSRATQSIMNG